MNKEKIIDVLENLSEIVNREEHNPIEANGIDRAIAAIQNLLDANRWIPVIERLPKDIVNPITRDAYVYPVTVDFDGVTDIRYYSFCRGHWYNQGLENVDSLVLAWMPLPEPYSPQNSGLPEEGEFKMFETQEIKGTDKVTIRIPGINEWSLSDLKRCCMKNKVKGYTKMSKEQLQDAVKEIIRGIAERK